MEFLATHSRSFEVSDIYRQFETGCFSLLLPDGSFQINFTGTLGASYSVLFSTNPALPLSAWTVVGTATNTAADQFQFTAPPSPGTPAEFYGLRSP
jgi:hypothetical protein